MDDGRFAPALRVVTWNVHACIGLDRRFDPERTAETLRRIGADVCALQEVDTRDHVAAGFDVFDFLAGLGGGHAALAITQTGRGGHYGHMLVSRWPIEPCRIHDVSFVGREDRKVIEAYVNAPLGRVRVIATHLGLKIVERRAQVLALRRIVESDIIPPAIVLGDFNELRKRSGTDRILAPIFGITPAPPTFPSFCPILPLDRIWAKPPLVRRRLWLDRAARPASDHLPLVAELDWPGHTPADDAEPAAALAP